MRPAYVALAYSPNAPDSVAKATDVQQRLRASGEWTCSGALAGLQVWIRPERSPPVLSLRGGSGFLLGDLFPSPGHLLRAGDSHEPSEWREPIDLARWLVRSRWGRYVAIIRPRDGGPPAVLRDPSGMLNAMAWTLGDGLDVVASEMTHVPGWLQPRWPFLNWDRITSFVAVPTAMTTEALVDDVNVVAPGELLSLGPGAPTSAVIWTPAEQAKNGATDLSEAAEEVVRRVDACTRDLVGLYDRVVMELSGGLDSSIVAGALGATGMSHRVAEWLNYVDDRPEANESAFARAVTDGLGVDLTTPRDWATPLDLLSLRELSTEFWPAIGGMDAGRDRDELQRLRSVGAGAMVSGQGGDGAFFQFPSALVIADEFTRRGARTLASPILGAVARRTRQSVWGVLGQVLASRRGRERRPGVTSLLLTPAAAEWAGRAEHRWVRDARSRGLPPGKVLHIQGIAVTHLYRGPSRRLSAADIILPLFAQPVLEHCLSIAVPDLAGESYDRPFARRAFADRLPAKVLNRRTKGDMSTYYARFVTSSLATLRPYLLEGCLCEARILDREILDRTLDPQQLISGPPGAAVNILNAAAVEAWVRHWQTRVPDATTAGRWARSAA